MKSHRRLRGHSATMIKQAREGGPCSRLSMQNWDRWFFVSMMVVSKLSVLGTDLERSWSWGRVVYCYKSNASNRSTKGNPTWELYKSIHLLVIPLWWTSCRIAIRTFVNLKWSSCTDFLNFESTVLTTWGGRLLADSWSSKSVITCFNLHNDNTFELNIQR